MLTVTLPQELLPPEAFAASDPGMAQRVLLDVMESGRAHWIRKAGETLHSSRVDYINGIQAVVGGDGWASVSLVGTLPVMVEEGASPYDMHDTLLGPNVPIAGPGQRGKRVNAEGGFYRSIPFRHQVPGTLGQGGGTPMGTQYFKGLADAAQRQRSLGRGVHKVAKTLAATTSNPRGGVSYGGRLPAGVAGAQKLRPHHSTDLFAGMVRQEKTYARGTQNTYMTFRTISTSVPDKWLHPGMAGAHIAEDVARHVEQLAEQALLAVTGG